MVTRDPGAELVALCDIRPREELGIEAYDVPFFSSLTELLQSGISIDVVNVCTPNGLHAAMAIQAVETGCNVRDREADGTDACRCREGGLCFAEIP